MFAFQVNGTLKLFFINSVKY